MVLEHSLHRRTALDVEITWLYLTRDSKAPGYCDPKLGRGWQIADWATPWTALRWAVPALCGWRGRAIYLDCPTLLFGDIAELWNAPLPSGAFALLRRTERGTRRLATCCIVFDCAAARDYLPDWPQLREQADLHQAVGVLLERYPRAIAPLPGYWGTTDTEFAALPNAQPSGSVSFTSPLTYPHGARAAARLARSGGTYWFDGVRLPHYCSQLVELFNSEYAAALAAGRAVEEYVFGDAPALPQWNSSGLLLRRLM